MKQNSNVPKCMQIFKTSEKTYSNKLLMVINSKEIYINFSANNIKLYKKMNNICS